MDSLRVKGKLVGPACDRNVLSASPEWPTLNVQRQKLFLNSPPKTDREPLFTVVKLEDAALSPLQLNVGR